MSKTTKVLGALAILAIVSFVGGFAVSSRMQQEKASLGGSSFYEGFPIHFGGGLYAGADKEFAIDADGNVTTSGETTLGAETVKWISGSIDAGERIDYWQNTTGETVYVDLGLYGFTSGTASTTFHFNFFATTTNPSTIASLYDYTALTAAINGTYSFLSLSHAVATSSTATTTNSIVEAVGLRGNAVVAVPNNGYLVLFMQNLAIGGGGPGCNGATCEAATSTNRGVSSYFWKARYVR